MKADDFRGEGILKLPNEAKLCRSMLTFGLSMAKTKPNRGAAVAGQASGTTKVGANQILRCAQHDPLGVRSDRLKAYPTENCQTKPNCVGDCSTPGLSIAETKPNRAGVAGQPSRNAKVGAA